MEEGELNPGVISKEEAQGLLGRVPDGQAFQCQNGATCRDLKELTEGLVTMSDEVFNCHVSPGKNAFSNWVKNVIKDEQLSKELALVNTRAEAASCLANRVTRLTVLATWLS
jgi:hypothetical protein